MEGNSHSDAPSVAAPWLMRVEAAAELLSVSRSLVYELINRGELPSVRIGGCRRIDAEALRRWIDGQRQ